MVQNLPRSPFFDQKNSLPRLANSLQLQLILFQSAAFEVHLAGPGMITEIYWGTSKKMCSWFYLGILIYADRK